MSLLAVSQRRQWSCLICATHPGVDHIFVSDVDVSGQNLAQHHHLLTHHQHPFCPLVCITRGQNRLLLLHWAPLRASHHTLKAKKPLIERVHFRAQGQGMYQGIGQ